MGGAPNWPVMESLTAGGASSGTGAPTTPPAPPAPSNLAPLVAVPLADQAATQDSAFSFTLPAGSFTDPDASGSLTYSATLANGAALPGWLSFNAATRTFAGTPLNAHVGTLTLRVTASDGQGGTASDDLLLTIANLNDAPTGLTLSSTSIAENSAIGTAIGVLSGIDPDVGDTLSYSIAPGGDPSGLFSVVGNQLRLAAGSLDFEATASYSLTVRVTDASGLMHDQALTLTVSNVNEALSAITDSNAAANSLAENATNGTLVGLTAQAADPDGGTVTYSLSDDAGGRFAIDANTGVVTVANGSLLNVEAASAHSITVVATSGGGMGSSASQSFTISLTNINEAPTAVSDSNAAANSVAENATTGTLVGLTAQAADADAGETFTYSLTDDAGGRFAIDATTGVVSVANGSLLNFEAAASHAITVRATDSGNLTRDQSFTISLSNVNEAPTAVSDSNAAANSVAENATTGTLVGLTAQAADADAGETFTYSLTDDAGGRFAIHATTGVVTVANGALLDFEAATSHAITVRVTDSGNLTRDQSFTISLSNVNEAPTAVSDSNASANSVAENATTGTLVGLTAQAADTDAGETFTYSLTDDAGGRFAIDPTTGVVSVANGSLLDFEAATSHAITVRATDSGNLTRDQSFTINLSNVNEALSAITDSNAAANSLAENATNGTLVGLTAQASDPDGGTVTYSLSDDAGGRFAIDTNTGVVTVANGSLLNFEAAPSHSITVVATSGGGMSSSASQSFTINLSNVNEAPTAVSDSNAAANSVAENATTGTLVGLTAQAADADAGESFTYSLTDDAGGRFAIHATTGVVTVANGALLDFEAASSHGITVRATDSGNLTRDQSFTISLSNVTEAPKDILLSSGTINENSTLGTVIGTLSAVDDDAGNTHTYQILSDPDGKFSLSGNQLLVNGLLNFEQKASHQVQIRVTDNTSLTYTKTLTLTVADINDAPVTYNQTFNLAENSTVGALVVRANGLTPLNRVAASDEDAGATLTYNILSGNTGSTFAINSANGEISVANASLLDFEVPANRSFTLTVQVSDGTLTSDAIVTINLSDINETLSLPSLSANSINENSPNGTVIGTLSATDPEGQAITYTLTGDAGGRFSVVGNQLRVANGSLLDFEANASHSITVQASDGVHTQTQSFTINVGDLNEGSINNLPGSLSGTEDTTVTLSGLSITDSTPGTTNSVTFSVASGTLTLATGVGGGITAGMVSNNGSGSVTITGATQAQINATLADANGLRFSPTANFNGSVLLTVSSNDGSGNTDIDSLNITVTAVNDAPTLGGLTTSLSFAENTLNATAQLLDTDITLSDVDSPTSFNGGNVRVAYVSGAAASDTLSVRHQGNGAGQIGVSGTTVSFGGVAIGTIQGAPNNGVGTNALQINLNASATLAAVEALLENLTYQSSANIPTASRTLRVTVADGAGGTSPNYDITVGITAENDAPIVAAPLSAQGTDTATAYNYTIPGGTFTDPDGDSMTYSMEWSSNNGTSWNSGTPTGLTFNPATLALNAPAGAVGAGSYLLRLTASDSTLSTQHSFAFNVTAAGFSYTGGANQSMGGGAASGNDIIVSGDGADLIYAGPGNDTIYGRGGNDTLHLDADSGSTTSATNLFGADLGFGGDGNDLIFGDTRTDVSSVLSSDTIYGENGNDTLYGRAGDDWLDGGASNDILYGETGNDTLYGSSGNDSLLGSTGNDFLSGDDGIDTLLGGTGNDTMTGGQGTDTLIGGTGGDLITSGDGADRFDYLSFSESRAGIGQFDIITDFNIVEDIIRVPFFTGIIEGFGNAIGSLLEWYQTGSGGTAKTIIRANPAEYDFYIELTGHINLTVANFSFYGTAGTTGNDTLTGSTSTVTGDVIQGGSGDDIIYGRQGPDLLLGGEGNDSIFGGEGDDEIDGEAGDDWLDSGGTNAAANTVRGGSGNDTITMSNANGGGLSSSFGDAGNDVFRFHSLLHTSHVDYVIIEDFEKNIDRIWLDNMPFRDVYIGGPNNTRLFDLRVSYSASLDLTFVQSNYNVSTRLFTFALRGNFATNSDSSLNLNASDFIFSNFSDNEPSDADTIAGVIRESVFSNNSGIIGTTGNDTIIAGYDTIGLSNGFDNINAGYGNDVIVYKYVAANTSGTESDSATNSINPSFGQDIVFLPNSRGTSQSSVSYTSYIANNFDTDGDTIISGQSGRVFALLGSGNDFVHGSVQSDDIRTASGNDVIYAQRGGDTWVAGGGGNDTLFAGEGNDPRVAGEGNDDLINGGYGGDVIWGGGENGTGNGADTFIIFDPLESRNATADRDRILDYGSDDTIILHGFTGIGAGGTQVQISNYTLTQFGFVNENWTDIFASDGGIDFRLTVRGTFTFTGGVNGTITFNTGTLGTNTANTLTGTASPERIFALEGNDTINAGDGNDSLWGGDGTDSVRGEAGDDSISGGFGNDTLIGGTGADTLEGGSGNDRFVFSAGDSDTVSGMDVIWDFREGNDADLIDLSDAALDALAPGGSLDWGDLVFSTPDQIGGMMTRVTISGTSFGFQLMGYWEKDYNIAAADFVF